MYTLKINKYSKKLLFIFLSAFLIRLIGLNQSFWLDEAVTANVVKYNTLFGIIKNFSPHDFHPPFYYLFLKIWSLFFGYSEIALRFPSLLFSLSTGYTVYKIGVLIKNKRFAYWSVLFFLFNPLIVYYSQEARMYMMATFFIMISFYFLLKNKWFFFTFFSVLSLYTFYGSLFFILTSVYYVLYKKQYKNFLYFIFYLLFFIFLISPLLYYQWMNARKQLMIVSNWSSVLGTVSFKNLFLIPLKFSFGRISFYPKPLYYMIAGMWTTIVLSFVCIGGLRNKKLFYFFTVPLIFGLIFSFFTPLLSYFRFLYLIPFMSILVVYGAAKKWQRSILFSGFSILTFIYLFSQGFHREDWKNLAQDVVKYKKVYMISSSSDPIKYYQSDVVVHDISELARVTGKIIIVIPYSVDIWGVDYQSILRSKNYSLKSKKTFRGVVSEEWGR